MITNSFTVVYKIMADKTIFKDGVSTVAQASSLAETSEMLVLLSSHAKPHFKALS